MSHTKWVSLPLLLFVLMACSGPRVTLPPAPPTTAPSVTPTRDLPITVQLRTPTPTLFIDVTTTPSRTRTATAIATARPSVAAPPTATPTRPILPVTGKSSALDNDANYDAVIQLLTMLFEMVIAGAGSPLLDMIPRWRNWHPDERLKGAAAMAIFSVLGAGIGTLAFYFAPVYFLKLDLPLQVALGTLAMIIVSYITHMNGKLNAAKSQPGAELNER